MKSRIITLFILLTAMWALLVVRAAFLQVIPNERLEALRRKQFETVVTLQSRRGDVTDRKGHELAISTTSYSLFADPKLIERPERTARLLAKHLHMSYLPIAEKLKQAKKRFVWVQRHLGRAKRDEIAAYKIRGLGFIEESKRTYPNETVLSHVLGFVGGEGSGLEGLEAQYNSRLEANRKRISIQRDARGRPLIVGGQLFTEAPDGADVELTIDRELQYIVEQEIKAAIVTHEADSATAVILDARTSEILAMANAPAFDPNRPADFPAERRRNRAIVDAFEPGSTMKTFVVGAALAKGLVEPNTKFDCEDGAFKIDGRVIHEADAQHKFKSLTVSEILSHSSNIGMTKIALKLGASEVSNVLNSFGFGSRTGVDLPAEAAGILQPLPWRNHLLGNISFGHGVAATPLQIANAYAAVANGGWLRRPYIVRRVRDNETGDIIEAGPKTIRRVLMPEIAAKLKLMLSAATGEGATGWNARINGFPVAGKTGTAQKVNPNGRGYLPNAYVSSFAGFLPVNDPKFVIYIAIDNPRKGYYGSQVAAPVFAKIAGFAVRQAGLAPVLITEADLLPAEADRWTDIVPASAALDTPMKTRLKGPLQNTRKSAAARGEARRE